MFDMGFTEILLIAVIALVFIGPDKLPETLRSIAKTLGKIKRSFEDAKETINKELQIEELKKEALYYKQELESAQNDLKAFKNVAQQQLHEINDEVRQIAHNAKRFEPKDINDDSVFDEFDEIDKEFEKLEKQEETPSKATKEENEEKQKQMLKDEKLAAFKNVKSEG